MITIHYCLRRKAGMSFTDFSEYWRGPHAELVKSLSNRLGIVRYVQNHATLSDVAHQMQEMRGTADPFDGIAAISFASAEDLIRGNTDAVAANAQRLLAEDEERFIDLERSVMLFTMAQGVIDL